MRQKQKTLRIAVATLSQAEVAVFKCILRGLSADAIAKRLGKNYSTVRVQILAVLRHFGVHSRLELMAQFVVSPPAHWYTLPDDVDEGETPRMYARESARVTRGR
jgi:DNA-binding CsgD family transcriptional regulator